MEDKTLDFEKEPKSPIKKLLYALVVILIIGGMLSSAIIAVDWFITHSSPGVVAGPGPAGEGRLGALAGLLGDSEEGHLNRIAFITPEGYLATIAPDGSDEDVLTGEGLVFQFPAWSPDGKYLATIGGDRSEQGVYLLAHDDAQSDLKPLYVNRRQAPFYLYWSPDSRQVSFLANHPTDILGLHLATVDGERESQLLATGGPLYWDWTGDGEQILMHTGYNGEEARLALIPTTGQGQDQEIAMPGFFQAPGISANGRYLAYAEQVGPSISSVIVDDTQTGMQQQERHAGLVAMSWSPTSDQLALISTVRNVEEFYGPLRLLDAQTGESRLLSSALVLAFFWSPDGRYIATIEAPGSNDDITARAFTGRNSRPMRLSKGAAQEQSPHIFDLSVIEVETGHQRYLHPLVPAPLFVTQFLPFFDQYAMSHRLWSPNSDALVLPMQLEGEDRIIVVPINGEPPTDIAAGNMPSWSRQ